MRETQIKPDSQWVGQLGGNATHKAKVMFVNELDGRKYITYERQAPDFNGQKVRRIVTADREAFLYAFREAETFFAVGGEYKASGYTYYIQEIYTISNPINETHRKQARAIVIDGDGKRWMEMLNSWDFRYAKRVK